MKKNRKLELPVLSLNAKVEQTAKFLRDATKASKKTKSPICSQTPEVSYINTIQQIARRLREEVHEIKKKKKKVA